MFYFQNKPKDNQQIDIIPFTWNNVFVILAKLHYFFILKRCIS